MKAILDHVGIAVADLPAALAFYRDGLGLDVHDSEDVASQRVRAHFVPAGEAALELLEATADDSAIAKYVAKRGPGLHHITLRVDDIRAALAQLTARGVRLIDEQPRPGAEGALVAFIHPSAAHGVLVELKQAAAHAADRLPPGAAPLKVTRYQVGELEVISLFDGFFRLDAGSMFGVVPKVLWSGKVPTDDRNRATLAMRPLVVRGVRTMLIDAGMGDCESEKFYATYAVDRSRHLEHALAEAGIAPADIDIVLATHLHFDHAGGFTVRDAAGRRRPRFPRARYVARRGEWDDASRPSARARTSYSSEHYAPLAEAGVLELVDDDQTIMPGVRVQRTDGHTRHHQLVWLESAGQRAVYPADLMPTAAHAPDAWIASFDLFPEQTQAARHALAEEVMSRNTLVLFDHDPAIPAGYLFDDRGRRSVRPAEG